MALRFVFPGEIFALYLEGPFFFYAGQDSYHRAGLGRLEPFVGDPGKDMYCSVGELVRGLVRKECLGHQMDG